MTQDSIIQQLTKHNEYLVKTIDSIKIQSQLDKLNYKIDTQNSIVSAVNSFYDSAWLKLIFVITILGIVLPIIVQYFQRKNIKDLVEGIKEKFDSKLDLLEKNNNHKIDILIEDYENKIKKLETKNKLALLELDANTYYLQGRALFVEKQFVRSALSSLKSAIMLNKCGRTDRVIPLLNNVIRALNHFDSKKIDELKILLNRNEGKSLAEVFDELEKDLGIESSIPPKITKIKAVINKIENSA